MKPIRPFTAFMALLVIGAAGIFLIWLNTSPTEARARRDARTVIAKAGGEALVLADAARLFARYNGQKNVILMPNDLKPFQHVRALGDVQGIVTDEGQPYIRVLFGGFLDGHSYILRIFAPNDAGQHAHLPGVQVIADRITVTW